MSGNGVFNNVSANGMNVTGILQASQIVTTQPMQVSNLSLTGALNLTDVNAAGDLSVAGSSTLTGAVTAAGAVTVNGVSTLNGDVNALVFAAATEVSSTGNTDIRASSGIDGDSLAIQGNPIISGDLSISGNVYVGGNVFTGITASVVSVLNSTGLVPTGLYVPDSQDVFYLNNAREVDPPSCIESVKTVKVPIFTDSTKTTYVNKGTTYASNPKSVLVDFPTANVYAPRVTELSNASINSVYAQIYSNANQTFDLTSHFSKQPLTGGVTIFSQDEMNKTFSNIIGYYTDRGYDLAPADYNSNYKNMFVATFYDYNTPTVNGNYCMPSIEFGYDTSSSIPSNVFVTAVNFSLAGTFQSENNLFYSGFLPAYKNLAVTNSNIFLQPVTIPVTTDPAAFSSAFGTPTGKLALYDPTKKEIHIYFNGSSNTYGSGNTTSAFSTGTGVSQITWNEVCELSHFEGSFALQKKRAQVTDSNRPFAPANSVEESAFLVQVSNNLVITSNVYRNGTQIFPSDSQTSSYVYYSATVTRNIQEAYYGGIYAGVVLGKVGRGSSNYDVYSLNANIPNAFSSEEPTVLLVDQNPYSDIAEYYPVSSRATMFNSNAISQLFSSTSYTNIYTDTPESLVVNMSPSSITRSAPAKVMEVVLGHEISHGFNDYAYGMTAARNLLNLEGTSTSHELSYIRKVTPEIINSARQMSFCGYYNNFTRGAYPLDYVDHSYEGQLHSLGRSQNRINASFISQYGESMFHTYVIDHFDTNQQVMKYANQLRQKKLKEGVIDAGFPTWINKYGMSIKTTHLALDAAIKTVTAAQGAQKSLAEVYTDYVVAQALLRNNSTIPDKYKTLYPHWIFNRDAPWISNLQSASSFSFTQDSLFWSDALDGVPIGVSAQAAAAGGASYNWSIGATQNDTLVPIWPKEGSDSTSVPFSNGPALNNLGAWSNAITRDAWTYTSNTYVTTPLVHQLEDMASFTYIMPIHSNAAANVYGTSSYVSNVAITVTKGDWVFKVVQFVPDGAEGTFIQSADINVNVTDAVLTLPSTWAAGTAQTIDINFSTIATTTTTSTGTVNTSGFQKECHGTDWHGAHVWYFPRLLCINKKNHDYGVYRNVYPRACIYSGYMTMQATVV
jgi:hypothetical protein